MNERFIGDSSKEIPIFETLLANENKIPLKLYSELNNKKNKKVNMIKYINKNISSWKKEIFLFLKKNKL